MGAQSLLTVKTPMAVTIVAALSDSLAMDSTVQVTEKNKEKRMQRKLHKYFVRLFRTISARK